MERKWECDNPLRRQAWSAAINATLRVLEGKWKIVIINELMAAKGRPLRFSELERLIPDVTQKMLIQQLKGLQQDDIIRRTVYPQVPPRVEYALTTLGHALGPAMTALIDWAELRHQHEVNGMDPRGVSDDGRVER
ncbi:MULTISPECIES: winged helix-turn-helix transcriptional regulator [Pseudomonas]|jgi:DNA-binding HxlR family transcriptional regulator|uniref:Winged helix-turn-helix transcriptional regulator n=1 Tax=Pseudomonas kulmbachensis TaxID=3043408 RepID=A0ABW7LVA9_9PSED|nr:helix-turn-helix domain-containing protein [Pseudomonas sp. V3/3/4/13]